MDKDEEKDDIDNLIGSNSHENRHTAKIFNNYNYDMRKKEKMGNKEFMLLWTLIFFIFLFCLCVFFDNSNFLWLLIVWFIGLFF